MSDAEPVGETWKVPPSSTSCTGVVKWLGPTWGVWKVDGYVTGPTPCDEADGE